MRLSLFNSLTYTNKQDIETYYRQHPWLKEVVVNAHKKLKEYFRSERFELCYKVDVANFEADDDEGGYLVLYVITKMKVRPAKDILIKFDEDYWVHQNKDCYNHLAISISSEIKK